MNWKRTSRHRHRVFQKGVSLLRPKSRDNVGTASTLGWPPDRAGRVERMLSEEQVSSSESRPSWVSSHLEPHSGGSVVKHLLANAGSARD